METVDLSLSLSGMKTSPRLSISYMGRLTRKYSLTVKFRKRALGEFLPQEGMLYKDGGACLEVKRVRSALRMNSKLRSIEKTELSYSWPAEQ